MSEKKNVSKITNTQITKSIEENKKVDPDTTPDILYFGSAKEIDQLDTPAFLSPYKGIAQLFTVRKDNLIINDDFKKTIFKYKEWESDKSEKVKKIMKTVEVYHNNDKHKDTEAVEEKVDGFIHYIDVSDIKDQLIEVSGSTPEREVLYIGKKPLPIKKIKACSSRVVCKYHDPKEKTNEGLNDSRVQFESFIQEASHGKLKNSFRIGINPDNGHVIKIIFDLNPNDIKQIGDHRGQAFISKDETQNDINNITKKGHNDFSSQSIIKAIVDMDTKQKLQTVKMIGSIGAPGTAPIYVPDEFHDRVNREPQNFLSYTLKDREDMIKSGKVGITGQSQSFKIGDKENAPSYKATKMTYNFNDLYSNQKKPGRGINDSPKLSVLKTVNKLKKDYVNIIKHIKVYNDPNSKEDVNDSVQSYKYILLEINKSIKNNNNSTYNNSVDSPIFRDLIEALQDNIKDMKELLEKLKIKYPKINIMESSNIIQEADISNKRKQIEELVIKTFDALDPTKINSKKYQEMFAQMNDNQFKKWMDAFAADHKSGFRWDIEEFGDGSRTPKFENIEKAASILGIKLFEYVYMPHVSSNPNRPIRTKLPVLVGYLPIKRPQQFVFKKTNLSLSDTDRDDMTGAIKGESKAGTSTGIENELLEGVGGDIILKEIIGARADNQAEYANMIQQIAETGSVNVMDIKTGVYDKGSLLKADLYLSAMGIKTDLISESYLSIDKIKEAIKK